MDEFSGSVFSFKPNATNLLIVEGKLLTKELVYLAIHFLLTTTYVAHREVLKCNPHNTL